MSPVALNRFGDVITLLPVQLADVDLFGNKWAGYGQHGQADTTDNQTATCFLYAGSVTYAARLHTSHIYRLVPDHELGGT